MKPYHQEVVKVSSGIESFFSNTFSQIHVDGPILNAEKIQQHPFMAICTHRSHVDYFLLGHELFKMGFENFRFAAGDNLTKLPYIGKRFKSFGAFTVERDNGFERHYVRNLCSSVVKMMEDGDLIIVFPEGGRSYSGAMLEMKSGILGAAIILQAKNPEKDVYYLPIAISYERLPDLPYFKMLLKGKKLRKKCNPLFKRFIGNILYFGGDILAFGPFMTAHRLNRNYGEVFVDYAEPVSIRSIIDVKGNKLEGTRDEFSAHRTSMQLLSQFIYNQLKSLYRLLPMHVLSSILDIRKPVSTQEARDRVGKLVDFIQNKQYNLKQINKLDSAQIVEQGIVQLSRFNSITSAHGVITVKKPEIINYYKASIDNPGE